MEGLPGDRVRRPGRAGAGRPLTRRRVVLLRHGRTGDNAAGRIQGQLDTPLDEVGRAQAAEVAPLLAAARPVLVLSSDLSRAADTAAPLAALAQVPVRLDARLRELDLGTWQGLTGPEARDRFPAQHAAWRSGVDAARGGGETYAQAAERAVAGLADGLRAVPDGGTLLAVTHGGTARATLCRLLGLEPPQWWRLSGLGNACWSVLVEHERGWRLDRHGVGPAALVDPASWPAPYGEPVRY